MNAKHPSDDSPRAEFLSAFLESVRKGIETLSTLPSDLGAKINETVAEVESRFETRMKGNRAGVFSWTGVPAPEKLQDLKTKLDRLEARLTSIENNIKALENHEEGKPWPTFDMSPAKPAARK